MTGNKSDDLVEGNVSLLLSVRQLPLRKPLPETAGWDEHLWMMPGILSVSGSIVPAKQSGDDAKTDAAMAKR